MPHRDSLQYHEFEDILSRSVLLPLCASSFMIVSPVSPVHPEAGGIMISVRFSLFGLIFLLFSRVLRLSAQTAVQAGSVEGEKRREIIRFLKGSSTKQFPGTEITRCFWAATLGQLDGGLCSYWRTHNHLTWVRPSFCCSEYFLDKNPYILLCCPFGKRGPLAKDFMVKQENASLGIIKNVSDFCSLAAFHVATNIDEKRKKFRMYLCGAEKHLNVDLTQLPKLSCPSIFCFARLSRKSARCFLHQTQRPENRRRFIGAMGQEDSDESDGYETILVNLEHDNLQKPASPNCLCGRDWLHRYLFNKTLKLQCRKWLQITLQKDVNWRRSLVLVLCKDKIRQTLSSAQLQMLKSVSLKMLKSRNFHAVGCALEKKLWGVAPILPLDILITTEALMCSSLVFTK